MIICKECGRHNPNGTTFCENKECGSYLEWSGEMAMTQAVPVVPSGPAAGAGAGPAAPNRPATPPPPPPSPPPPPGSGSAPRRAGGARKAGAGAIPPAPVLGGTVKRAAVPPTPKAGADAPRARRVDSRHLGLTLNIDGEREISVEPNATVFCQLTVKNTGTVVDRYVVQVLGDASRWARVEPAEVNLVPAAEAIVSVSFTPPRRPDVAAGMRPFRVVATSSESPQVTAFADGTVTVGSFNDTAVAMQPTIVEGQNGTYTVTVENRGNVRVDARLEAADPRHALAFRVEPPVVAIPPGGRGMARVSVAPRDTSLTGEAVTFPFRVVAQMGWDQPRPLDAQFVYRPRLGPVTTNWWTTARVILTMLGSALMVLGAFGGWLQGIAGTKLTYSDYVNAVFKTEVPPPPESVDPTFVAVGILAIALGVLVFVSLASRSGLLTRLIGGFSLLLFGAIAFTITNAGRDVGSGLIMVIAGALIALIGGICGMIGRN
jgi:hypothetical protein